MYLLHYAPDNASLIVRLVLEEMGLPYRTRLIDRATRAQDGVAYRQINPTGLIPALEVETGAIFETGAILLWLCDTHGRLAPAPNAAGRADFLKWLFFTSNTLHADMRQLFYPDRFAGNPEALGEFTALARSRIARHLSLLDALAGTEPDWLCPTTPSGLGYYIGCLLRWLALYPKDAGQWFTLGSYPALLALATAQETRPAARKAALAEGLGETIFTAPTYACPPEGSAT